MLGSSLPKVALALELEAGRAVCFEEGIAAAQRDDSQAFLIPHENGVFIFYEGVGFSDFADRLSHPGSAYTIYLDAPRVEVWCSRSIGGRPVREIAKAETLEQRGRPAENEPSFENGIDRTSVLDLAATWGPDPLGLVKRAPRGLLYETGSRHRRSWF